MTFFGYDAFFRCMFNQSALVNKKYQLYGWCNSIVVIMKELRTKFG